jgi:membrane peptidoglycan carboxypeptidase
MRDVVHYYAYEMPGAPGRPLRLGDEATRKRFLAQFVDMESREFLHRFWSKYADRPAQDLLTALADGIKPVPDRVAVAYRMVEPQADFEAFAAFMQQRFKQQTPSEQHLRKLYEAYAPGKFGLADMGYIARLHPLELWVVKYLRTQPDATFADAVKASVDERQASYKWLFTAKSPKAQELRIRTALENAAFEKVTEAWRRLGYPFERLVPSYATAIGTSADKPAALADLMGILVNGGIRRSQVRVTSMQFAVDTPFETNLVRDAGDAVRVLQPEIAEVARRAVYGVVEKGTARRVHNVFKDVSGKPLVVGGKTGTGDHRYDVVGKGGQIISSRVVNRAATFTFYLGDRFFGTVTAFVPGEQAGRYDFTSALPVQILKELEPALRPLLTGPAPGALEASRKPARPAG